MENKIWFYPEIEIKKMLDEEKYEMILNYVQENQQHIFMRWFNDDLSGLKKTLRLGSSLLHFFESNLIHNKILNAVFRIGTLLGTVESFERLLHRSVQDESAYRTIGAHFSTIKHLDDIVYLLEMRGEQTHSEICNELRLKDSTLSEIMKKVYPTGLIVSVRSGKYKLYSLTDFGHSYGRQLKKKRAIVFNQDEIVFQIQKTCDGINRFEDKQAFIKKIDAVIKRDNDFRIPDRITLVYPEETDMTGEIFSDLCELYNSTPEHRVYLSSSPSKKIFSARLNITNSQKEEYAR